MNKRMIFTICAEVICVVIVIMFVYGILHLTYHNGYYNGYHDAIFHDSTICESLSYDEFNLLNTF